MVKYLVLRKAQNLVLRKVEATVSWMALKKATHLVQKRVKYLVLMKDQYLGRNCVHVLERAMGQTSARECRFLIPNPSHG
jgi:hypothetical protein